MAQSTDGQPSNVITEDVPRPPDDAVVTSDSPPEEAPKDDKTPAAAGSEDSPEGKEGDPGTNDDQAPAPDTEDKPSQSRRQKRIKRLTAKVTAAEQRAEAAEKRAQELEDQLNQAKATPDPEPTRDNFETDQQYAKAYSRWEAKQTAERPKPKATTDTPADPEPNPAAADFMTAGREKLGDLFDEAVEEADNFAVDQYMGEHLMDSDLGAELFVYLSQHPDESRKIADFKTAGRKERALEAIEQKITAGEIKIGEGEIKPKESPAPATKQTKAPPPPSTKEEGTSKVVTADATDMEMEDYAAMRKKQLAAKH